ncbi:MAG: integrase arm-type DNA-binding domain-containing protein [Acidobacteriota bacterium]
MPRKTLTDRFIRSLKKAPKSEVEYHDTRTPGLSLRISRKGRRVFVLRYRLDDRRRRLRLMEYRGTGDLASARRLANTALDRLDEGIDPQRPSKSRGPMTFAELAESYMEQHAKPSKATWPQDQWMLKKDILPAWAERPAKDIRPLDVRSLLIGIRDRGAPIGANRVHSLLSKIFNFGLEVELVESNPLAVVKKVASERPNLRVLSDFELRKIWRALSDDPSVDGLFCKLVLLMARRPTETLRMSWSQVHGDVVHFEAALMKSRKHDHVVYLSTQAQSVLRQLREITGDTEWLFPAKRPGRADQMTWGSTATSRLRKASGVDDWSPKTLQMSAATILGRLRTPEHLIDLILAHVPHTVTRRHYNLYAYEPELREAMQALGDYVEGVVGEVMPTARPSTTIGGASERSRHQDRSF